MAIRIGKTLPPSAAPLGWLDLLGGLAGICEGDRATTRFLEQVRAAYRTRCCFGVSSGKAALVLILQALKVLAPGRDEVLIPAYTCYSVPSAIARAGLKVALCDLQAGTLELDFGELEKRLENPRLLCVIATHLFGMPSDVQRVREMANRKGVYVIEDAAQAMGAEWEGKKLGTLGDVGIFSLGRGKALSTVEGGLILTDSELIGSAIRASLEHVGRYRWVEGLELICYAVALVLLIHPRLFWLPKALPFLRLGETVYDPSFPIRRLSSFQAGLARGWMRRLERFQSLRRRNCATLARSGIRLPRIKPGKLPDLIRYPVVMPDRTARDAVVTTSERLGLGVVAGYPDSIDGLAVAGAPVAAGHFPQAKRIAETVVSLPVHPLARPEDMEVVARLIHGRGGDR